MILQVNNDNYYKNNKFNDYKYNENDNYKNKKINFKNFTKTLENLVLMKLYKQTQAQINNSLNKKQLYQYYLNLLLKSNPENSKFFFDFKVILHNFFISFQIML